MRYHPAHLKDGPDPDPRGCHETCPSQESLDARCLAGHSLSRGPKSVLQFHLVCLVVHPHGGKLAEHVIS